MRGHSFDLQGILILCKKQKKKIVLVARPEVEEDRVEDPAEPFRAPLHSSSGPVTKRRVGRELSGEF